MNRAVREVRELAALALVLPWGVGYIFARIAMWVAPDGHEPERLCPHCDRSGSTQGPDHE